MNKMASTEREKVHLEADSSQAYVSRMLETPALQEEALRIIKAATSDADLANNLNQHISQIIDAYRITDFEGPTEKNTNITTSPVRVYPFRRP